MIRLPKPSFALFLLIIFLASCAEETSIDLSKEGLIPKPRRLKISEGSFEIKASTPINMLGDQAVIQPIVDLFNSTISSSTGFELTSRSKAGASNGINLYLEETDDEYPSEGYSLEIVKKNVVISSRSGAGLFNGVQTLLQMLPPEIHASSIQDRNWLLGTGIIRDRPEYWYRGLMLDVARHFFSVEDVKKVIDYAAMYKLNRLHLHLSDDQGWRIEIKSWPKLTSYGGQTQVGGGEGGFYTQEEYKDIIDYAAKRYITIIPEIDMPGHTNSALASYPVLNCNNKAPALYTGIDVGFSTLCTDKEEVYQFVDDVIRELAAMTPGEYIHIGGDESLVTEEEDYKIFMNKTQEIVKKHGKKSIGWDEIATTTMHEGSVVQFWNSVENAKKGVIQDAKIIMSPAKKTYLDMQYDSTTRLGLHWAAYIEADSAYSWHPENYIPGIKQENIIGVEAPLWSETIETMDDIEYMLFPRLTAIAEIAWTYKDHRDWESYSKRVARHSAVWDVKGINYYKSPKIDWDAGEEEVED